MTKIVLTENTQRISRRKIAFLGTKVYVNNDENIKTTIYQKETSR